jgi:hypothetical protein
MGLEFLEYKVSIACTVPEVPDMQEGHDLLASAEISVFLWLGRL